MIIIDPTLSLVASFCLEWILVGWTRRSNIQMSEFCKLFFTRVVTQKQTDDLATSTCAVVLFVSCLCTVMCPQLVIPREICLAFPSASAVVVMNSPFPLSRPWRSIRRASRSAHVSGPPTFCHDAVGIPFPQILERSRFGNLCRPRRGFIPPLHPTISATSPTDLGSTN